MRIDCHLHTNRYSPCSSLDPATACSCALERGLDSLVITEHSIQWSPSEIRELQQQFPKLQLYSGLEVSLAEGCDVVVITPQRGLILPFGTSLEELLQAVSSSRSESFLFLAHAFRWTDELSNGLERVLEHMDGLEMNSTNILDPKPPRRAGRFPARLQGLYESLQKAWQLVPLFNSDAHASQTVGSLANDLDGFQPPADESGLAELLKQHSPQEHQNLKLLKRLVG